MKNLLKIIMYLIIFLVFDFILTNSFFINTKYWNTINDKFFSKKEWRIISLKYHHDLKKNIDVEESWGSLKYRLITNSLSFRDKNQKKIKLENNKKKRVFMIGDSFIEGVGYNYEDTVVGHLDNAFSNKFEFLNASVVSYSPSIYYTKTAHYIEKGLKFDYCFIFLDVSDIADENFIDEDTQGNIFDIRQEKNKSSVKGKFYSLSRVYRDNFASGKLIAVLREVLGDYKSSLKKKFLASKKFNSSFFELSKDDLNIYKSTHIDRSMWTYDKKYSKKWEKKGLQKADYYMSKLVKLLKSNDIKTFLVIYPNPGQILYNNENVNEMYWIKWSSKNNIPLVNLYKYFNEKNKKEIIKKYFIPGDVHWNKDGNLLIYQSLKEEIFNNLDY